MAASTTGGYRTPIPNRDVETRARGSGEVTTRMMTDEERAKYFPAVTLVPRDSLGERINRPVAQKTNFAPDEQRRRAQAKARYQKEEKDMSGQAASDQVERFVPSKVEFLKGIAEGKAISKLERQWEMNPGSLHYWVGKWDLKGIKKERAEQLLDEIAAEEAREAAKPRGLHAINDQFGQTQSDTQEPEPDTAERPEIKERQQQDSLKFEVEIERLRHELGTAFGERNRLREALEGAAVVANQAGEQIRELTAERDNWEREYDTLEKAYVELLEDRDAWRGRAEELKQTVSKLESERQLLLETIEKEMSSETIKGMPETSVDNVNAPSHYTVGGIETIDFIRAKLTPEEFIGYCKGNALKYVSRATFKGGDEDLRKANKYLEWAVTG